MVAEATSIDSRLYSGDRTGDELWRFCGLKKLENEVPPVPTRRDRRQSWSSRPAGRDQACQIRSYNRSQVLRGSLESTSARSSLRAVQGVQGVEPNASLLTRRKGLSSLRNDEDLCRELRR